jgi:hypothetical protein
VPIFIAEGFAVFTQNTDNVRNTDDLTNAPFICNTGLLIDKKSPIKTYISEGVLPSFKDHNNETNIERCYKKGKCYYDITISLQIEGGKKTLHLSS